MSKSFLDLLPEEYLDCYRELADNADRHFRIATILTDHQEYGSAVSYAILGSEELFKAIILYLSHCGLKFLHVEGSYKYFRDHSIRHEGSLFILFITYFAKTIIPFLERFRELIHNPQKRNNLTEFEKAILDKNYPVIKDLITQWGDKHGDKIRAIIDFWISADLLKQKGFYVDYIDGLQLPKMVNSDEYKRAIEVTNLFRAKCKYLIGKMNSMSDEDRANLIDTLNNNSEFYESIKSFLSKGKYQPQFLKESRDSH